MHMTVHLQQRALSPEKCSDRRLIGPRKKIQVPMRPLAGCWFGRGPSSWSWFSMLAWVHDGGTVMSYGWSSSSTAAAGGAALSLAGALLRYSLSKSLTDSNKCFYRICLSRIIEGRSVRRLAVIHTLITYHKMTKRQTDKIFCHLFDNVCHRADFCRGDELVP